MNRTEAMEKMCTASSVVKLTCGICNNAAWLVCLDAMDKLKSMKKNSELTEDDVKNGEKDIQKLTDRYCDETDKTVSAKEKEIMSI